MYLLRDNLTHNAKEGILSSKIYQGQERYVYMGLRLIIDGSKFLAAKSTKSSVLLKIEENVSDCALGIRSLTTHISLPETHVKK